MLDYNLATGCGICVYDDAYVPHFSEQTNCYMEEKICSQCKKLRPEGESCEKIHINAIKEASKKRSFYIYQCDLGFFFWTSPIYDNSAFSGAIRCGGVLQEGQKAIDIFSN